MDEWTCRSDAAPKMLADDVATPDTLDAQRCQLFHKPHSDLSSAPHCNINAIVKPKAKYWGRDRSTAQKIVQDGSELLINLLHLHAPD
eukprot:COSAG02_NODE_9828_length_2099_cov_2.043500_2_plen_88_part_00